MILVCSRVFMCIVDFNTYLAACRRESYWTVGLTYYKTHGCTFQCSFRDVCKFLRVRRDQQEAREYVCSCLVNRHLWTVINESYCSLLRRHDSFFHTQSYDVLQVTSFTWTLQSAHALCNNLDTRLFHTVSLFVNYYYIEVGGSVVGNIRTALQFRRFWKFKMFAVFFRLQQLRVDLRNVINSGTPSRFWL